MIGDDERHQSRRLRAGAGWWHVRGRVTTATTVLNRAEQSCRLLRCCVSDEKPARSRKRRNRRASPQNSFSPSTSRPVGGAQRLAALTSFQAAGKALATRDADAVPLQIFAKTPDPAPARSSPKTASGPSITHLRRQRLWAVVPTHSRRCPATLTGAVLEGARLRRDAIVFRDQSETGVDILRARFHRRSESVDVQ
jgi:hypothetical protein